jgi:hypothetical protein
MMNGTVSHRCGPAVRSLVVEGLIAHGDEHHAAGEGVHAVVPDVPGGERVLGGRHHKPGSESLLEKVTVR